MEISSLVVKTAPEHLNEVLRTLESFGGCDIHFNDESGKIVITIESSSNDEMIKKMQEIIDIKHVVTADLAYTYSDENQ
ncbi:MAG: chaperone NapD [Nitrospirae bacterium]|nr:chaperone NapD [Nitrospirota bacterium]MBF0533511.1 chaperone NapD [Nitrospirota bacterium]MBF0615965.1 chaperone NapD [Nitrospirota bacterium]